MLAYALLWIFRTFFSVTIFYRRQLKASRERQQTPLETFSTYLLRHYGLFAKKRRPYNYGRPYLYASIDRICYVITVLLKVSMTRKNAGMSHRPIAITMLVRVKRKRADAPPDALIIGAPAPDGASLLPDSSKPSCRGPMTMCVCSTQYHQRNEPCRTLCIH